MAWVVILVVLVLGALVAVRLRRRSRSDALRRRFGPEYERLVALFRQSDHAWGPLVKALVTSPIVTNAAPTETAS